MSECCSQRNCRREQPIRLMRGGMTGKWYFVTDYAEHADGTLVVKMKHDCSQELSEQLDAMHETYWPGSLPSRGESA
jgi:hypothetical protein